MENKLSTASPSILSQEHIHPLVTWEDVLDQPIDLNDSLVLSEAGSESYSSPHCSPLSERKLSGLTSPYMSSPKTSTGQPPRCIAYKPAGEILDVSLIEQNSS